MDDHLIDVITGRQNLQRTGGSSVRCLSMYVNAVAMGKRGDSAKTGRESISAKPSSRTCLQTTAPFLVLRAATARASVATKTRRMLVCGANTACTTLPTFSCHEPPAVIAEPTTLRLRGGSKPGTSQTARVGPRILTQRRRDERISRPPRHAAEPLFSFLFWTVNPTLKPDWE